MKFKFLTVISLALAALCADAATVVNKYAVDTEVCDPVLIYTGGLSKRATWNKVNLRSYLTHLYADGHRDWFYDAFIFNETNWYDSKTNETRVLVNAGGGQLPGTKADWEAFLDHIFADNHDIAALDALIGEWKEKLGEPRLKHKVIIGLCFPCKDGRGTPKACEWKKFDFGTVNGVDMDFSKEGHRIIASKWYIDEALRRFEEKGYKNLELAGFYCPEETLYTVGSFVKAVNDYIHEKGYRSYWIPYWANNDQYALNWKDRYHFDMTWRQPNYFFYESNGSLPPINQLNSCIRQSKQYGLGLELEFETSGTSNGMHETSPEMHQRLIDYIDAFEEFGVWDESGVAHYGGSKGYCDMAASLDPVNQATMDRLCDIVIRRQNAFAGDTGIEDNTVAPEVQFAYPGTGSIFIPADFPAASVYNTSGMLVHSGDGTFFCRSGIYIVTDGNGRTVKVAVK